MPYYNLFYCPFYRTALTLDVATTEIECKDDDEIKKLFQQYYVGQELVMGFAYPTYDTAMIHIKRVEKIIENKSSFFIPRPNHQLSFRQEYLPASIPRSITLRRRVKGRERYYYLEVFENLFGEIVLERSFGSVTLPNPKRCIRHIYATWEEADAAFELHRKRKEKRGYQ